MIRERLNISSAHQRFGEKPSLGSFLHARQNLIECRHFVYLMNRAFKRDPAHQHIALPERRYNFKPFPLEHRNRSSVLRVGTPTPDWIRFYQTSAPASYGGKGSLQCGPRHATSPVSAVDDKAGYSPQRHTVVFSAEVAVVRIVFNTRQFLLQAILTPPYWLSLDVNDYSVRASTLNKGFLSLVISLDSRSTRPTVPLILAAREMVVHAPTRIRPWCWMSLKKPLEVGPRLLR